jgi:iron complex transport system ATP-binding protein
MVEIDRVDYAAGGNRILRDVSVTFADATFTVIAGPNGAGKSTLLKIASGLLAPASGTVKYDGTQVRDIESGELARRRAVLSQNVEVSFALTVHDVVMIGRFPHYGGKPRRIDREIVDRAIEAVDLADKRDQLYPTLSGGEKQKAQLARVLAQLWGNEDEPNRVLFLDEPVTGLDIHYQLHILEIARSMLAEGCAVIAILHDLNMGLQYADRTIVLNKGSVALDTTDSASIPPALIESVFAVRAERSGGQWRFSRKQ